MKAIISGASRGIGKAIAQELAKEGYDLVLLARTEKDLEQLKGELQSAGSSVETLAVDLSNTEAIQKVGEQVDLQGSTLLINNLGVYENDNPIDLEVKNVERLLQLNLYSAIELTKLTLPFLQSKPNSKIINIGSVMSWQADKIATAYSISKHAFKAWNDGLREELREKGIGVSCLLPGAVNTSSWDGIPANRESMIQAEDIAFLVATISRMNPNSLVDEIRLSPLNFKG